MTDLPTLHFVILVFQLDDRGVFSRRLRKALWRLPVEYRRVSPQVNIRPNTLNNLLSSHPVDVDAVQALSDLFQVVNQVTIRVGKSKLRHPISGRLYKCTDPPRQPITVRLYTCPVM